MRFLFKTDYGQDVNLAKHGGHVFWYSALMVLLVAAPWLFAEYWLAQLTFILIYSIVGLGLGPVTGVPLPFVSHGGSSLLANLVAIGLLLSISRSVRPEAEVRETAWSR